MRFPESNEIVILELPKVGFATGLLADWMRFVYAQKEEDFMQAAAQNPLINKAYGVIRTLSQDEEARLLAESREKALRDIWSMQEEARDAGKDEILMQFLMHGMTIDQILAHCDCSRSHLESLSSSLKSGQKMP